MSTGKKKSRVGKLGKSKNNMTWETALEEYLLWKKAEGRSERTIRDYKYHVSGFFKRFPDASLSDFDSIKRSVAEYMAEDVSPAYYNNKLVYLKTFCGWCVSESVLSKNPLKSLKRKKVDDRIVQIDDQVIKKLLDLPDKSTFSGLRDYALLLLQLDTGIRPKEALALMPSDINFQSMEVYIRAENAKTRIARTVPISPITAKAIQKLLNVRPADWENDVTAFCTYEGMQFSGNGWYKRVSEYGTG